MSSKAAGIAVGLVGVLAAGAVWMVTRDTRNEVARLTDEKAAATAVIDDLSADVARLETELANERRRAQRAESETAKMRTTIESVQEQLAAATAPVVEEAPEGPVDWREVVKTSYPAYSPEGLGDALATVDWDVVAESMSNMPPLIAELATHLVEGKPMTELPAETVGSIQRYNGPLVTTAMRLSQKGVVGTDVNGAFSHPGFMSNALAATLLALDMPLGKAQSATLEKLTADYAAREARRAAGYGDDAYALEKIVDESRLKHDYFAEVYALLTAEQHDAVRPEAVRGRTQLDIFCESLVWSGKAGPMVYTDREDLARKVTGWASSRGRIPQHLHEQSGALVTQWVDRLPEDALRWEADGLVNMGMLHVENVTQSAGHVLALLKTFDRELDLDAEQRKSLRAVPGSIVLYRQAAQ